MLIQPFAAAVILQAEPSWDLLPAGVAVLLVFTIREPLVVLGRQALVWRARRPESARALRWVLVQAALLAVCGWRLAETVPWDWLLLLGGAAAVLTLTAVWMIVGNRRRSVALQAASMAGLGASSLLPPLVAQASVPGWAWWLWALLSAHNVAAVFVVHARLEMRAARADAESAWRRAVVVQAVEAGVGVACMLSGLWIAAAAPLLSAAVHGLTLRSLTRPEALRISITQVGIRALALSLVVTAIAVGGLIMTPASSSDILGRGETRWLACHRASPGRVELLQGERGGRGAELLLRIRRR